MQDNRVTRRGVEGSPGHSPRHHGGRDAFAASAAHAPEPLERRLLLSTVVSSVAVNGGAVQRSMVTSVSVTFNADVGISLNAGDLVLWNHTTRAFVDTSAADLDYDAPARRATWTFPALPGGSLPDGNYRATLRSMTVHDTAGNTLDGNADGKGGDEYYFAFHRLLGDADGDRDVDATDDRAARNAIGTADARFDADGDGDVDFTDYNKVLRNRGKRTGPFAGNRPPNAPAINEPLADGQVVSGQDVHMEAPVFADPDAGQTHTASDWEIWTTGPNPQRVWSALGVTTEEDKIHIHFAQGQFEGPQAGKGRLEADTDYVLRTRQRDNSGDPGTQGGQWSVRLFRTMAENLPGAQNWTVDQPGYKVEEVPFLFAAGEENDFRLPVNVAFVPDPGPHPNDVLFYVAELYGTIRSVTRNLTVRTYADGLLNYNPTGRFSGDGEGGLTGIVVDPQTGDVFASLLYDINPTNTTLSGETFPKVTRFTSVDGGLTAVDTSAGEVGTQGTDILRVVNHADSPTGESQLQSHIISDISFGPDGKLYVHNGEGFQVARAQNLNSFGGKILRMNRDGSPPSDNPFYDPADRLGDGLPDAADYVYAYGFRNPFGGAWSAADGAHYQVGNGPSEDRFAKARRGVNYLWDGSNTSMRQRAMYVWSPATAPVDLAFVQPQTFGGSGFPASKQGRAFVTQSGPTYGAGPTVKRLVEFTLNTNVDGDGNPQNDDGAILSGPTSLVRYTGTGRSTLSGVAAGPDGLYFTTLYADAGPTPSSRGGKVLRVIYTGKADFTADRTSGPLPLTVRFTDTSDVAGATSWLWDFGDGATSTERNPTHTYATQGRYNVKLTVTGAHGPVELTKAEFITAGNPPPPPVGTGLTGVYYNENNFTAPVLTRIDPTINFNWAAGSPDPSIGVDTFSVRWTGQIRPAFSETYTFYARMNDGVRVRVNGQLVIDDLTVSGFRERTGSIALVAGQRYDIEIDYFENTNNAEAKLEWSSPSVPRAVVPQERLFPTAAAASASIAGGVPSTADVNDAPAVTAAPAPRKPTGLFAWLLSVRTGTGRAAARRIADELFRRDGA